MRCLSIVNSDLKVLIDTQDYPRMKKYKWYLHRSGRTNYARTVLYHPKRTAQMHRIILGVQQPYKVDHINGDGLDNRRKNLRLATTSQNGRNRRKQLKPTASRFKGVCWCNNRWHAKIRWQGKKLYLGCFKTEQEAGLAYKNAAIKFYKEFANYVEP